MTIAINGLSIKYDDVCARFKLPDGKFISQKEIGKSIMDELEKNKFNPSEFNNFYKEGIRDAKESAAFFNAKKMMPRGTEDAVKSVTKDNVLKNMFDKVKNSKFGQKVSGLFSKVKNSKSGLVNKVKNSKVGQKASKTANTVAEETKNIISKPGVKKGLKYAGVGLAVLGGIALVGYLGKKAYDAYQKRQQDKAAVTPAASGLYDVKSGDNVWNIAKKDLQDKGGKVTNAEIAKRTEELMKLNNLKYANDKGLVIIKPGQQIKLS